MTNNRAMPRSAAAPACRSTPSKAEAVVKLLSRTRGATLSEITEAIGWQPHSIRSFLTGLRKQGRTLARDERKNGVTAYRLTASC